MMVYIGLICTPFPRLYHDVSAHAGYEVTTEEFAMLEAGRAGYEQYQEQMRAIIKNRRKVAASTPDQT